MQTPSLCVYSSSLMLEREAGSSMKQKLPTGRSSRLYAHKTHHGKPTMRPLAATNRARVPDTSVASSVVPRSKTIPSFLQNSQSMHSRKRERPSHRLQRELNANLLDKRLDTANLTHSLSSMATTRRVDVGVIQMGKRSDEQRLERVLTGRPPPGGKTHQVRPRTEPGKTRAQKIAQQSYDAAPPTPPGPDVEEKWSPSQVAAQEVEDTNYTISKEAFTPITRFIRSRFKVPVKRESEQLARQHSTRPISAISGLLNLESQRLEKVVRGTE